MVKDFKRWTTQLAATVLYNGRGAANLLGADMTWKNVCLPGVNCGYCRYAEAGCPWGLTQHTLTGFTLPLGWRVWGLLILCALFLGRMICGWLCPFGWAQELLDKLPMLKLSKNKITYYLSYFKYVVLLLFACDLYFFDLHGLDWRWIIGLLAAAALFIYRPFCRFFCPLGAFYSLFNRIAVFGMQVDSRKCTACQRCVRSCLMDCKRVGDRECIVSGKCSQSCPTEAISLGCKY